MNERIKELALQAKLGPALLLHYYRTIHALTDTEQEGLEQIEKFAELIVRECMSITDKCSTGPGLHDLFADNIIAEHFGVEE